MGIVRPSELELQVLGVLWERGPSTVREVWESMPDGKDRAYTTVLSVLQALEKKGLVDHTQEGQANRYHALAPRKQVVRPLLKDLLRNVFGGSPARAIQGFLDASSLKADDLAEIRGMIDEAEKKTQPKEGRR